MRILLIHSYYLQRGGEDVVFGNEQMLIKQSEQVQILEFNNESGWKGAHQFLFSVWNIFAARKLKDMILQFKPDVIHLHNLHFAIGPLVIRVAKNANVPIVMTLHNYRLLCPSTTLSYKGRLYINSINSYFPWEAIYKKVYRNSIFETFWLAFVIWFHKKIGTWQMINKYLVLTEFSKKLFVNSSFGIPSEKFVIKPNFVNCPSANMMNRKKYFLYIGRLSAEKGIQILIEAFRHTNYNLRIAGDGPLKKDVIEATEENLNINFLGSLNKSEVQMHMQECTALVFPSVWFEGMPMTLLEAFAAGTPVIASNLGTMVSMITDGYNGLHFEAGNPKDLVKKLNIWQQLGESELECYRENAYATFKAHYTAQINQRLLMDIYKNVSSTKLFEYQNGNI